MVATTVNTELQDVPIPYDIELYGHCPLRCGDKTILVFYLERIAAGVSPRMAETLAMQQAPGIGITTDVYMQDQRRHGSSILAQHNGDHRAVERLRKALAKRGYALKSDDQYVPTVARFHGDPEAIVNHTNTLDDLKRNLSRRGVAAEGAVELKARDRGPAKVKHSLNPKVVERIRQRKIQENPELARTDQRELREQIISKHGSKTETI